MKCETEQTSTRGLSVEQASSGDSSHCKPREKFHLVVGSVNWAYLTAETPKGRNNRVKRRDEGNGVVLTLVASFPACKTARLQQTQAALIQPTLLSNFQGPASPPNTQPSAGSRHSSAQSPAGISTTFKHLQGPSKGQREIRCNFSLKPLNNKSWAVSLIYINWKRESIQIQRILYHQCLV